MVDAPGTPPRGRLSLPTLLIASVAATAAAIITSKLWAHGAILSTAITPLIVAIVSELLHRPADRVAQHRAESQRASAADLVRPGGDRVVTPEAPKAKPAPVHARRHIHLKPALATGAAAFAIAAVVLTLAELIFGGALATNQGTTLFGGGASKRTNPPAVSTQHPTTNRTTTTTSTTATTTRSTTTTPSTTGTTTPTTTTTPQSTTTQSTGTTAPATTTASTTTTSVPAP